MRHATAESFSDGTIYSAYGDAPAFAARADWLIGQYGTAGRWLIAGCGWGFLVQALRARGVDAYGVDASAWAIAQAPLEIQGRLSVGDCADASAMAQLGAFAVVVTEDMLPMAESEAEVAAVLAALRPIAGRLCHIVTMEHPGDQHTAALLWRDGDGWAALVAPDDLICACDVRIA